MDWRDLLAWQQPKVTTWTFGADDVGPQLIVNQNPSRIYLSISQADGDNPHSIYPGSPGPDVASGIPIGGATQFVPSAVPVVNISGNDDPETGNVNLVAVYPKTWYALAAVPATLEYWPDRHGVLCQMPWSFIADGCDVTIVVVEVMQERNPCDYIPGTTTPRSKGGRKGSCDTKQSLRQFTGIWHGANAFGRGRNLFSGSVGFQRPQNQPAVQPNQYQSGLD